MKIYTLVPLSSPSKIISITVGWDPALRTFFIIAFDDAEDDILYRLTPKKWFGRTTEEITSPSEAVQLAAIYAEVPATLLDDLKADQIENPAVNVNLMLKALTDNPCDSI